MKDYDDRYHMTDITIIQQQLEDSKPIGELNIIEK